MKRRWILTQGIPFLNMAVLAFLWMRICEVRGKPSLLGLLILVPGVNIGLVLYLALSE